MMETLTSHIHEGQAIAVYNTTSKTQLNCEKTIEAKQTSRNDTIPRDCPLQQRQLTCHLKRRLKEQNDSVEGGEANANEQLL
ncbi:hypothetical protein OUZ56_007211 [Daphnia magna]|uniref:Uncharacterized protein n=1 Tax=Daphnia magna TaxID=35525 RepID=A0ABQ9YXX9_9CRUS|nr:hypothetical protein OUZ56_007211 [Daphnia magna]